MDTKENRQEKETFINTKRLLAVCACTLASNNIQLKNSEIHVLLQDSPRFSMEISRFTIHSIDSKDNLACHAQFVGIHTHCEFVKRH